MNILLIGGGGREHAIARSISKSPVLHKLYILPGNPGMSSYGINLDISIDNLEEIEKFVLDNAVTLIVVGPEAPLVAGFADHFKKHEDILVIGPTKQGAMLEGSKAFAKTFMKNNSIPTARYFECDQFNFNQGYDFIDQLTPPIVLKADGLAAGKGVLIIDDKKEAKDELTKMLNGKFGSASSIVVIEEFLSGIEFSVFVLTDGKDYILLPEAKDYKRIGEGDTGLNTGGMGAISPVPFFNDELREKVVEKIIKPTIDGLASDKIDYVGFIFFGLINVKGEPYVIEYNCRLGDPETEVVFPRIESDVVEMFESIRENKLREFNIVIDPKTAATVVLVSGGYPGEFKKEIEINFAADIEKSIVFHSGTKMNEDSLVTNGGRVFAVTSFGDNINEAVNKSLQTAKLIDYDGKYYRKDIGKDLI